MTVQDFERSRTPNVLPMVLLMVAALGVGLLGLNRPTLAALAGLAVLALGIVLQLGSRFPAFALGLIGFSLLGYAFLGKGFAYFGVPPLFIGEVALASGLLAAGMALKQGFPFRHTVGLWVALGLFMLLGLINTLPHIQEFGIDALRDAVTWGYAAFAFIVGLLVLRLGWFDKIISTYGRYFPYFLIAAPIAFLITRLARDAVPLWPISGVPMLYAKGGDVAVHLAGIMVFMLLGMHRFNGNRAGADASPLTVRRGAEWMWWLLWVVALSTMFTGRAAMLTIGAALVCTLMFRPLSRWGRPLFLMALLVAIILPLNLRFDLGSNRELSLDGLLLNLRSIAGQSGAESFDGTRTWRLMWWDMIVQYTVHGNYFWYGKGYGLNLASVDGFQTDAAESLRNPHSIHLTFLARSGVPGLVSWIIFNVLFAGSILAAFLRARAQQQFKWASIHLWILAYWLAFIANASFDVYLEGPQGGIWFWCVIGFGIAALELYRREERVRKEIV